jgi:hypothetical protein
MAVTAQFDPITVEPVLSAQKVTDLVQRGMESAKLDYKREVGNTKRARLEIVKDVLAMANTAGGYILVGVGDTGEVVGIKEDTVSALDEASLRQIVASHTQARISLFASTAHEHLGLRLGILTVLPLRDQIAVASKVGADPAGGKAAFRDGDVLVRHGSASERWNQSDADYITQRIALVKKLQWYEEFAADFRGVLAAAGVAPTGDVSEAAYDLPADEFRNLAVDLLRGHDG